MTVGSAYEWIGGTAGSGSSATIVVQNIPTTYKALKIITKLRHSNTGGSQEILFRVNNNSTASAYNYKVAQYYGQTTKYRTAYGSTDSSIPMGFSCNTANDTSGFHALTEIDILNPGSSFFKTLLYKGFCLFGTTGDNLIYSVGSGAWKNTATITEVSVTAPYNLTSSSRVDVYGVK